MRYTNPSVVDGVDSRALRQPITCVSLVAGGGATSKEGAILTVYWARSYGPKCHTSVIFQT